MRVTLVLPGTARSPVGGYKVAFEHANGLARRGHRVTVLFPALLDPAEPLLHKAYRAARFGLDTITKGNYRQPWFPLLPCVERKWVPSLAQRHVPDGDAIVATGWPTAEAVAAYGAAKGRKFYLIQHFETWWGKEPRVVATWRLPLHKIVIARWLGDIAKELGEAFDYIPNGLDFTEFGVDTPVESRDRHRTLMLYHEREWKGSREGLEALRLAHAQSPRLRASLFGVFRRPRGLPDWVEYFPDPSRVQLRALYNRAAVFLAPSWTEGWPLPPAEAMMSGCALVATDIGGHREYAEQDVTALLAPPRQPEALAERILLLMADDARRRRLATAGANAVRKFTWDLAVTRLEKALSHGSA